MFELLLLAGMGAIGGASYLILKSCPEPEEPTPKLDSFPAAQVQGPRLHQLKRKGMLNPEEMATYIQFLEGKLGIDGDAQMYRVPQVPQPAPPAPESLTVHGFPTVPHSDSPQVPHGASPQVPQQVPHFEIDLPEQDSEGEEWDPIDAIFEVLEASPGISKSQIAFQVFGLTREDKSGSPNSKWMKAMGQIDHCIGLLEQAKANDAQHKLKVLMGGKTA